MPCDAELARERERRELARELERMDKLDAFTPEERAVVAAAEFEPAKVSRREGAGEVVDAGR